LVSEKTSLTQAEASAAREQLTGEQKGLTETLDTALQARGRLDDLRADISMHEQTAAF
jgi:hypothetical protein